MPAKILLRMVKFLEPPPAWLKHQPEHTKNPSHEHAKNLPYKRAKSPPQIAQVQAFYITDDDEHTGKPSTQPYYTAAPLDFAPHEPSSYYRTPVDLSTLEEQKVVNISKVLYSLNSTYDDALTFDRGAIAKGSTVAQRRHDAGYECKDQSVALIARALLNATTEFVSVLPVRLEFDKHEPSPLATCHYALAITTISGLQTILPLCLWMFEGKITRPHPHSDTLKLRRQWDWKDGFRDLVTKFSNAPILRCTDVVLVTSEQSTMKKARQWTSRRYATTWDIATRLSQPGDSLNRPPNNSPHNANKFLYGWQRFASLAILANKIIDVAKPVNFYGHFPAAPFVVVRLNSFDFTVRTHALTLEKDLPHTGPVYIEVDPDLEDGVSLLGDLDESSMRAAYPVDGRRSCGFHLHCMLHPKAQSRFCPIHHRIVAQALSMQTRAINFFSSLDSQAYVNFRRPADQYMAAVRLLHELHMSHTVWVIDVEFAGVKSANAVPFILTVRDAKTDNVIISTAIDCDSILITDLEVQIQAQQQAASTSTHRPPYQSAAYFAQFYQGDTTCGMSLQAIGHHLKTAAGFSPDTHRILSWYCSTDVAIFSRAVLGDNNIISFLPYRVLTLYPDTHRDNYLQPVNLALLLKVSTDLQSCRCGFVHQSLFPGQQLEMHWPDNDT
ncbi:Nn.00g015590.m01.CDS01 [Neocucurbitaria sp. VM-36]